MYEFVSGPLLWMSAIICVGGFIYRAVKLFRITQKRDLVLCPVANQKDQPLSPSTLEERKLDKIARLQNSLLSRHFVMITVSTVFHLCLFAAPVLLLAHNLMFYRASGIRLPCLPDGLADLMTILVLACALFFLMRRIAIPRVAAISSRDDYAVLFLAIAPYLTGFFAYHQLLFDYKTVLTMHIFTGDLLLIALPFTKIGHMAFFFFSRLTIASEHSAGCGSRIWST
ncbi:MAG: hypothetical protein WCL16_11870 [bacterium]